MTSMARVTIDASRDSPAQAIKVAARSGPLVILSERAFRELIAEVGGLDAAMAHLLRVAQNVGKPIGINAEGADGKSSTAFIAPRSWSAERLRGWVGGRHEGIEDLFGPGTVRRT